jgi:hypothetical protein
MRFAQLSWWRRRHRLPDGALRPASHVRVAQAEDRMVLLDARSSRYWGLDDVGSAIWSCVERGCDARAIAAHIEERYDASAEKVAADTQAFLEQLAAAGLVEAK